MTGLATRTFEAQDKLVQLLADHPSLAEWDVCYGMPARRTERHIWVDEQVADWSQEPPTTGILTIDETFTMSVFITRRLSATTALELRQEIQAAAAVVADVMGQQPFLGGILRFAYIAGGEYDAAFADPKGNSREGAMRIKVACEAFLTSA